MNRTTHNNNIGLPMNQACDRVRAICAWVQATNCWYCWQFIGFSESEHWSEWHDWFTTSWDGSLLIATKVTMQLETLIFCMSKHTPIITWQTMPVKFFCLELEAAWIAQPSLESWIAVTLMKFVSTFQPLQICHCYFNKHSHLIDKFWPRFHALFLFFCFVLLHNFISQKVI